MTPVIPGNGVLGRYLGRPIEIDGSVFKLLAQTAMARTELTVSEG